jgi:glycerophosphoryl diester phosphodiesterase
LLQATAIAFFVRSLCAIGRVILQHDGKTAHAATPHPAWYGHLVKFVALYLCLVFASACGEEGPTGECPALNVVNVGHRGTGTNSAENPYPENTIPSFVQAQTEGASMLELDVTHSSDGVLMVIHDAKVDRTTDGMGCVGDMTVAELQMLDAAAGTSLEGTGVVIPTLAEVLAAVDADINIEIKVHDGTCSMTDRALTATDVVNAINGDTKGRRFTVSSFDADMLTAIQGIDENVYLGLLSLDPADASIAATRGFAALNVFSLTVREPEAVQAIRDMGLEVTVWTENSPFTMADHLTSPVDMIITDEPEILETARAVEAGY